MPENPTNPTPGTEGTNQISDYYSGYQQLELQSAETEIRKARNALLVVAALTLILNLIVLGQADALSGTPLLITIGVSAIFAGLAFWTKQQPLSAIIVALVLYVGLWIFDIAVLGPERLIKGIIFKAIIIYFLVRAIKPARYAERLRKELSQDK